MPFFEYMLLAVLGSAPAAIPGGTPARTITADSVTQPSGGTVSDLSAGIAFVGQDTGGDKGSSKVKPETGKKPLEHARSARHHRRGHRHGKVIKGGTGKLPSKS